MILLSTICFFCCLGNLLSGQLLLSLLFAIVGILASEIDMIKKGKE
jgi:hypothetical protein